jgi:hypothetical protein
MRYNLASFKNTSRAIIFSLCLIGLGLIYLFQGAQIDPKWDTSLQASLLVVQRV